MDETPQSIGVEDRQVTVLDVAASKLLAAEVSPVPPKYPLRELRLALVCYGGVSLAIYMHGVTKEFEKLVAASVSYDRDQESHGFDEADTAGLYWSLLKRLEADTHARTKVVVDIVSGTSAGGINGVFLATAIARNRSQEPLRAMWLDKGDIKRLLTGHEGRSLWLKAPRIVRSIFGRKPLLDGDRISKWLREALAEMGEHNLPIVEGLDSLLGPQERLQLFVPITDFFGYDVQIPADDPEWILDRTHRHIMQFIHDRRDATLDHLSVRWNDALAFSARATSSFPGAFPPLSINDYERSVQASSFDESQRRVMFASYAVTDRFSPSSTHFVDGGVLDNKPFATTVAAVKLRPAATEVDRRLIYVEPDPTTEAGGAPDGTAPGLVQTIIGGYAGIPRQEPILGDLTDLGVHNSNVSRVRDVIETNFQPVRERVGKYIAGDPNNKREPAEPPTTAQVTAWRLDLAPQAVSDAGFSYPTYLRLRLRAVLDDFATLIAERRGYPLTSAQAHFIGRVLREWAERERFLEKSASASEAQRDFIGSLDLAYHERHVRFLIAALSWWYNPSDDERDRIPNRDQLDTAKHELYQRIDQLNALAQLLIDDEQIRNLVEDLFGPTTLRTALTGPFDPFVDKHAQELTQLHDLVQRIIGPRLASMPADIDADVVRLSKSWTHWARSELLTRHLGFAFWDVILFPIQAISGVNERDHVELMRISPHEATILATPAEKELKGITLGHFGAFFSRAGRENDYLWGRLDTTERLIALLSTGSGQSIAWTHDPLDGDGPHDSRLPAYIDDCKAAARLIVASERDSLTQITSRLDFVTDRATANH